jgi:hypothetical protein
MSTSLGAYGNRVATGTEKALHLDTESDATQHRLELEHPQTNGSWACGFDA